MRLGRNLDCKVVVPVHILNHDIHDHNSITRHGTGTMTRKPMLWSS